MSVVSNRIFRSKRPGNRSSVLEAIFWNMVMDYGKADYIVEERDVVSRNSSFGSLVSGVAPPNALGGDEERFGININ